MIKNIIFDFDGVLVDSEILARKAFSQYLNSKNHKFSEEEFSLAYSGNKLVEVIKKLSIRFGIQNEDVFFKEVMALSRSIYMNELQPVIGVKKFLNSVNQNKLIGSNRDKHSLIQGLKLTKLKTYFEENNIFSFDMVSQPKPDPEIFLKALEDSKIHSNETIVIEDSVIGVEAAVKALKEGHHGYTPGNGIIEFIMLDECPQAVEVDDNSYNYTNCKWYN